MNALDLYEKKIISDNEFPVQLFVNRIRDKRRYFIPHWHEHIELHYILRGKSKFQCNRKKVTADKGSLVVINSYELHEGKSETNDMDAIVMIFEMNAFSQELAGHNIIFQTLIEADETIQRLMLAIYQETQERQTAYKLIAKGMMYELITYLIRNYAVESLTNSERIRRNRNLERLNTVLVYISEHYSESISNQELADLIHLSEDRFNHVFKESIGISPLNYINEMRLKKAMSLLKKKEFSVTEVALSVGFQDFNHFGRLFRRYYQCTPSEVTIASDETLEGMNTIVESVM